MLSLPSASTCSASSVCAAAMRPARGSAPSATRPLAPTTSTVSTSAEPVTRGLWHPWTLGAVPPAPPHPASSGPHPVLCGPSHSPPSFWGAPEHTSGSEISPARSHLSPQSELQPRRHLPCRKGLLCNIGGAQNFPWSFLEAAPSLLQLSLQAHPSPWGSSPGCDLMKAEAAAYSHTHSEDQGWARPPDLCSEPRETFTPGPPGLGRASLLWSSVGSLVWLLCEGLKGIPPGGGRGSILFLWEAMIAGHLARFLGV